MKILHIATSISSPRYTEFNSTSSGYGYMVNDIFESQKEFDCLDPALFLLKYPFYRNKEANIIGIRWFEFLNLNYFVLIPTLFKLLLKYGRNFNLIRDIIYYFLIVSTAYNQINKFDAIHLHGCEIYTSYITKLSKIKKIPLLITLHGLNSVDGIKINKYRKLFEKHFLKKAFQLQYPDISFVSTGSMKIAYSGFTKFKPKNFWSIPNGTSIDHEIFQKDIKTEYGIPRNHKVILYIGNLCKRKNQIGICNALTHYKRMYDDRISVIFIGRDNSNGEISSIVDSLNLQHNVKIIGFVDKKLIPTFISQANGVALISFSEGFGLGLIESLSCGIPCLMVDDMDGFEDIFSENCCVKISSRNPEIVANGIRDIVTREWNKDQIKVYAEKFSLKNMTIKYINLYKKIIK